MRCLLINPPWVYKRLYTHGIYPPYGLLMVATLLKRAGHDVTVLDANALDLEEPALRERVAADAVGWDAVGITTFTDSFAFLESFGPWLKAQWPARPLVLGGPLASGAPEVVQRAASADVVALDEAFHTVVPLFEALGGVGDLGAVPGLLVRDADGALHRTGRPPAFEPLDALPLPDWDLLPVEDYLAGGPASYQIKARLPRYLSTITTLGCPYRCTFCQVPVMFDGVRLRSPESMVAELRDYQARYAVQSMYFRDDILFRPARLARAFEEADLGLQWSCLLRADMMTERTLRQMKAGGCAQVRVGFESGAGAVLERANKKVGVDDNVRCIERARRAGLDISGFLIVGLPGETEASLDQTLRFVEDNAARGSVHFPLPLPGTPLYRDALDTGQVESEAWLLRRFSEPQLPGAVLQPPPVNFTDLPNDVLVGWAMRIADAARGLSTGFAAA